MPTEREADGDDVTFAGPALVFKYEPDTQSG